MKKSCIAFLCLLLWKNVFCQQQKDAYVEVAVQDTVKLDADEIIFELVLRADIENARYIDTDTAAASSVKIARNEYKPTIKPEVEQAIANIITKQKIDTIPQGRYSFTGELYRSTPQKKIMLRFSGKNQLAAFIKEVKGIENTYGFIVSKKSSQLEHYRQLLTKRILEKAFNDVQYIASQSKKTIITLVAVTEENKEPLTAGWTSYPPLSALEELAGGYDESNSQIVIERKLRVKYSWR